MDRRAAGALLALAACFACSAAAPTASNQSALDLYEGAPEGCYYNFQHYGEGDRIMTNEPCLNCTCHNRMLMCYLRVCPFTKAIGQDCTVEKRADQCCPIVTCPDVPVDLLTSTSTTSPAEYGATGLGKLDKYGCSISGKYFPEGSKVPPTPNKPCEHCYCIRNMTTCVMQECTLHVDGCTPIYHKDVCCPVRYSCDHPEDELPLLDDMSTTIRPTPGFLLTTTTISPVTQMTQDCVHDDRVFSDGALIKTEKACEHCYCMKGDIVCVVQECGAPMENEGKNCTSLPPREGQCCPDTYICEGDELTSDLPTESTTESIIEKLTTLSPPRRTSVEGSGYRNEPDESPYTDMPIIDTEVEGSGDEEETSKPLGPDEIIPTPGDDDQYIYVTTKAPAHEEHEKTTVAIDKAMIPDMKDKTDEHDVSTNAPITGEAEKMTTSGMIEEEVSEPHKDIPTTKAPEIYESTTTELGDSQNTVPDVIPDGEISKPHEYVPSTTNEPSRESESLPPIDGEDYKLTTAEKDQDVTLSATSKPVYSTTSSSTLDEIEKETATPTDISNVTPEIITEKEHSDGDITRTTSATLVDESPVEEDKETSKPELFTPSTTISPVEEDKETSEPEELAPSTASSPAEEEKESSKPEQITPSTTSSPLDEEKLTTEPDHAQNTVAIAEDTESTHPHSYIPTTTAVPVQKEIDFTTAEPDRGLNTIPGETYEDTSYKPSLPGQTTLSEESKGTEPSITTDEMQTQGIDIKSTTVSELTTPLLESIVTKGDQFTVTTEPSFRKEDEGTVSTEKPKENEATTVKSEFVDEGLIPTSSHDDKIGTSSEVPTTEDEFTTSVPEYVTEISETIESKQTTTESTKDTSIVTEIVPEKVSEPSSEKDDDIPSTTEKLTEITPLIDTYEEPSRIPGEGDCLLNGITYRNNTVVPSTNNCHTGCRCASSIIKCDPIICSPPPDYMDNCQSIYDSPDSCCPTFVCDHPRETVPPQSDNQMSGTESPMPSPTIECRGDQCEISQPTKQPMGAPEPCTSGNCLTADDQITKLECGSEGCGDVLQKPDTSLPSVEHTEECSDGKCKPESCANGKCQLPQTQVSPVTPCEGEQCEKTNEVVPEPEKCKNGEDCKTLEIPTVETTSCEGESCNKIDCGNSGCGSEVNATPSDHQLESCKEENGCKPQDIPILECTGDAPCRRKEISASDAKLPTTCEGPSCISEKATTVAQGVIDLTTELPKTEQTHTEESTEKIVPAEGETVTETDDHISKPIDKETPVKDIQEMGTYTTEDQIVEAVTTAGVQKEKPLIEDGTTKEPSTDVEEETEMPMYEVNKEKPVPEAEITQKPTTIEKEKTETPDLTDEETTKPTLLEEGEAKPLEDKEKHTVKPTIDEDTGTEEPILVGDEGKEKPGEIESTEQPTIHTEGETKKPVIDEESTQEPTIIDEGDKEKPLVGEESTKEPDTVDENDKIKPLVDEESTQKPDIVDEDDKEKTVVDEESTKKPDIVDEDDKEKPSISGEESTKKPDLIDEDDKEKPVIDEESTKKPDIVNVDDKEKPAVDEESTKTPDIFDETDTEKPVVDEMSTKKPAIIDNDDKEKPVVDEESTKEPAIVDEFNKQKPVIDEESTTEPIVADADDKEKPGIDEETTKEPAIIDEDDKEKPITDEASTKEPAVIIDGESEKPIVDEESTKKPVIVEEGDKEKPVTDEESTKKPDIVEEGDKEKPVTDEETTKEPAIIDEDDKEKPATDEASTKEPEVIIDGDSEKPVVDEESTKKPDIVEEGDKEKPVVDEESTKKPDIVEGGDKEKPVIDEESTKKPDIVEEGDKEKPVVDEESTKKPDIVDEDDKEMPVVDEESTKKPTTIDEDDKEMPVFDKESTKKPAIVDEDDKEKPVVDESTKKPFIIEDEDTTISGTGEKSTDSPAYIDQVSTDLPATVDEDRETPSSIDEDSKDKPVDIEKDKTVKPAISEDSTEKPIVTDEEVNPAEIDVRLDTDKPGQEPIEQIGTEPALIEREGTDKPAVEEATQKPDVTKEETTETVVVIDEDEKEKPGDDKDQVTKKPSDVEEKSTVSPVSVTEDGEKNPIPEEDNKEKPVVDEHSTKEPAIVDEFNKQKPVIDEESTTEPIMTDADDKEKPGIDEETTKEPAIIDEDDNEKPVVDEGSTVKPDLDDEDKSSEKPHVDEGTEGPEIVDNNTEKPASVEENEKDKPSVVQMESTKKPTDDEGEGVDLPVSVVEENTKMPEIIDEDGSKKPQIEEDTMKPFIIKEESTAVPDITEEVGTAKPIIIDEGTEEPSIIEKEDPMKPATIDEDTKEKPNLGDQESTPAIFTEGTVKPDVLEEGTEEPSMFETEKPSSEDDAKKPVLVEDKDQEKLTTDKEGVKPSVIDEEITDQSTEVPKGNEEGSGTEISKSPEMTAQVTEEAVPGIEKTTKTPYSDSQTTVSEDVVHAYTTESNPAEPIDVSTTTKESPEMKVTEAEDSYSKEPVIDYQSHTPEITTESLSQQEITTKSSVPDHEKVTISEQDVEVTTFKVSTTDVSTVGQELISEEPTLITKAPELPKTSESIEKTTSELISEQEVSTDSSEIGSLTTKAPETGSVIIEPQDGIEPDKPDQHVTSKLEEESTTKMYEDDKIKPIPESHVTEASSSSPKYETSDGVTDVLEVTDEHKPVEIKTDRPEIYSSEKEETITEEYSVTEPIRRFTEIEDPSVTGQEDMATGYPEETTEHHVPSGTDKIHESGDVGATSSEKPLLTDMESELPEKSTESDKQVTETPVQSYQTPEAEKEKPTDKLESPATEIPISVITESEQVSYVPEKDVSGYEEKTTVVPEGYTEQQHHVTTVEDISETSGPYATEPHVTAPQETSTKSVEQDVKDTQTITTDIPSTSDKEAETGTTVPELMHTEPHDLDKIEPSITEIQNVSTDLPVEGEHTELPGIQTSSEVPQSLVTKEKESLGEQTTVSSIPKEESTYKPELLTTQSEETSKVPEKYVPGHEEIQTEAPVYVTEPVEVSTKETDQMDKITHVPGEGVTEKQDTATTLQESPAVTEEIKQIEVMKSTEHTSAQTEFSETTPYLIELEEHTHKIVEELTTLAPTEEENSYKPVDDTSTPSEEEHSQKPVLDISTSSPSEEEHSYKPVEESSTSLPAEEEHSQKPVDDISTASPSEKEHSQKPVEEISTSTPSEEEHQTQKPVDDISTSSPSEEEHSEKPVEDISTPSPSEEEHSHKPAEDISTVSPFAEENTPKIEEHVSTATPFDEKPQVSELTTKKTQEEIETATIETEGTTKPSEVSLPEDMSDKVSESIPLEETTPAVAQGEDDKYPDDHKKYTTIAPTQITEESTPVVVTDSEKLQPTSESDIAVPTEKEISTSEKPPHPIVYHETTAQEEEFIFSTTKATTIRQEEDNVTPVTDDKIAKPEEKPGETIDVSPSSTTTEVPKPSIPDLQPTDEIPVPDEDGHFPPSGTSGYGEPDYVEEDQTFGPGTCRYGGKVYVSAQQIPRDDPCDFCFCFRSDIICLQQSCPPPIHGCHEEPIQGFCCPRYECPVSMATTVNVTTTTTTTTTTLPPHFPTHSYKGAAQRRGCQIKGHTYKVGEVVRSSSGPCLHCTCGGDGQMKCDPKACTPEPMLRQMIAAAVSAKRRR